MKRRTKTLIIMATITLAILGICGCSGSSDGLESFAGSAGNTVKVLAEKVYGSGRASLSWDAERDAAYKVLRAEKEDGEYTEVYSLSEKSGKVTFFDNDRKQNKKYFYKIEKIVGDKTETQTFKTSKETIIATPKDLNAVNDGSNVKVTWGKVNKATKYVIYRSKTADGELKKVGESKTNSFVDKKPAESKNSFYKVMAVAGKYGENRSGLSKAEKVYVKLAKPDAKGTFDKKSQFITITWKPVKEAEKYYIYRQSGSGSFSKVTEVTGTSYEEMASKNGVYNYKVAGVYTESSKDYVGNLSNASTIVVSSIVKKQTGKMVALTFDDGPGPYTQQIVDCLAKNNARATFFVLGQNVGRYPGAVKSAYENGNEIANHSYSHPILTQISAADAKSQIKRTDDAVKKVIGKAPNLVRTPGGAFNDSVKKAVGKPIIMWSIDTLDWKTRDKIQTINSVMRNVKDGDIILMHDIHKPTLEAALELIPMLKNEGYQLVTVSELARAKGYSLQSGKAYYSIR